MLVSEPAFSYSLLNVPVALMHFGIGLLLAPLMGGIINKIKAFYAGRCGRPLLQGYYDLARLTRKGIVYSNLSTWVLHAGPIVNVSCLLVALSLVPFAGRPGIFSFSGDFIFLAGLLSMGRFGTMLAALDTGSAFCGMGASREATYGALAESAFFLSMAAAACESGSLTMSLIFAGTSHTGMGLAPLVLILGALMLLLLLETSRFPFDDPETHLELTMIHEAMTLDHAGPDLAAIEYASMLKMWVMSSLITGLLWPLDILPLSGALALAVVTQFGIAVMIGLIESNMARLRLIRIPQLLAAASIMGMLALFLILRPV